MAETNSTRWSWGIATDPVETHELLCACDRFQAERHPSPVPRRSFATTEARVREGAVHLLRADGEPAGMFTLTWQPPFDAGADAPPDAGRPAYLGRLAVHPRWLAAGSMVGVQCVRRAIEAAREAGADVLRSEANPDLAGTWELLRTLGFTPLGPVEESGGVRRAKLQKTLR
jgi:hypothetical protein